MGKRQCVQHSLDSERFSKSFHGQQMARERDKFLKQKKAEKCVQMRLEGDLRSLEIGRRQAMVKCRTEKHMFQKLTADKVQTWRDQILGQRYSLAPLKQILDEDRPRSTDLPELPPRADVVSRSSTSLLPHYGEDTTPILPEIESVSRANTSFSDHQIHSPSQHRRLTFPDIEKPQLKRTVVYSKYGGKLVYQSEDRIKLYDKVRLKRIELLQSQQKKLSTSVMKFTDKQP